MEQEKLKHSQKDKEKDVQSFLKSLETGDWFVLHQIGKNVDPYFFNEFVTEVASMKRELRKKKSKIPGGKLMRTISQRFQDFQEKPKQENEPKDDKEMIKYDKEKEAGYPNLAVDTDKIVDVESNV